MRDEQIVLYRRRGMADFEIARELGHSLPVVLHAFARARALGIRTRRTAAAAHGGIRRTT
jgi:DNA-binding CsgD family transcriptional regulator